MKNYFDRSHDTAVFNSSNPAAMAAEINELRQRLAAIEAASSAGANRSRGLKINSKVMGLSLIVAAVSVAWIVSGISSVVHSQNPDPLTIDKNGNVGIKTTTPNATLDVNGGIQALNATIKGDVSLATASLTTVRFSDGTTQTSAAPPRGAVIAFNLSSCPGGWSEYVAARGRFIRGIDTTGSDVDPDGRRAPGNTQEDAIRNITGTVSGVAGAGNRAWDWGFRPGTQGAFDVPYNLSKYNPYGGGEYEPGGGVGYNANFDASRVVPTAKDNRPKNVALLYCQKD